MASAPVQDRAVNLSDTDELFFLWREQRDRRARDALFDEFLPLARSLARRYANPHEPLEDLVQVASMGLLGAIDRFDPRRGPRFPSFAVPTILGELKRHFRDTGWSAHVPRGAQEMALRVERASRQLAADSGHAPGIASIADHLNVSVDKVLLGLEAGAAHYGTSLDAPLPGTEDDPQSLADNVGGPDDRFGLVEIALSLSAATSRLPYQERQVLTMRINHNLKQSEIAEHLGCSQMQVSRLLRRAAAGLRQLTDPDIAPRSRSTGGRSRWS